MFDGWEILQINDPIIYKIYGAMHMDLHVFVLLSLHWVSTKLEVTMIVTQNDSQMMKLDAKLSEEFLKPKFLNSDVDYSFVLSLY